VSSILYFQDLENGSLETSWSRRSPTLHSPRAGRMRCRRPRSPRRSSLGRS